MKIAICDDDIVSLGKIKNKVLEFISTYNNEHIISLDTFENGFDLLSNIDKGANFDLIILDIVMPGLNGIQIATELRNNNDNCKIIFLTTSPEFAVDSYKVDAFYYLLKPFNDDDISIILKKAIGEILEAKSFNILLKEKNKLIKVNIIDIQYIESIKHTIVFHINKDEIITCYGTMNDFSDILLKHNQFIKCHRSFIVNMDYVISLSNKDFILSKATLIPISRQAYQQVKTSYIDYFFKKGFEL